MKISLMPLNKLAIGSLISLGLLIICELHSELEVLMLLSFSPILLVLQSDRAKNRWSIFRKYSATLLVLIIWQLISFRWLYNTGVQVPIVLSVYYALTLSLPFLILITTRRIPEYLSVVAFCGVWFIIETFHAENTLGVPTQGLGFYLNEFEWLIQWYKYSGVISGSLFVLSINFLITGLLKHLVLKEGAAQKKRFRFTTLAGTLVYSFLIVLSLVDFTSNSENADSVTMTTLHTSLDPWKNKYKISYDETLNYYSTLISDTQKNIDTKNSYLIMPENALPTLGWLQDFGSEDAEVFSAIQTFKNKSHHNTILIGGVLYEQRLNAPELSTKIVRPLTSPPDFPTEYYMYNTVVMYNDYGWALRTKIDLVPFEEYIPDSRVGQVLDKMFSPLGPFSFSTRDSEASALYTDSTQIGPIICFESARYKTVNESVEAGAHILAIILNEGWYNSDKGANVFQRIAKIRAIETSREVAKSSNLGFSGKIDSRGLIRSLNNNRQKGEAITNTYTLNKELTFFVRYGENLYFLGSILAAITAVCSILYQAYFWLNSNRS